VHRTHPRAKHLKVRVEANGEVIVTTPKRTSQDTIQEFVTQHHGWIVEQQAKMSQKPQPISTDQIMVFGKTYPYTVIPKLTSPSVMIRNGQVEVSHLGEASPKKIASKLNNFIKHTAQRYIIPRTHQISEQMKVTFRRISLKEQKTRWGSCSSNHNLNFNWRLAHYQPHIIDYVLIHELAHLKHLNHSKKFWQLVGRHDPDYRRHRDWLKQHGMTVT
jgi:predicted metal-dependent hydrolase